MRNEWIDGWMDFFKLGNENYYLRAIIFINEKILSKRQVNMFKFVKMCICC